MSLSANNPEISILLATLRPSKARKCIESIIDTSEGVNYEIVVVSPLAMPDLLAGCPGYDRIKFVRESKKEGCNKAFSTAYENASGNYVFAMADDSLLAPDCLKNLLEFMKPHQYEMFLAGARFYDAYGPGPECTVYGFYYAFNPCIRKDLVEQLGGFYDLCFKSFYGDPDLSLRVWQAGGKVELCPDAWIEFRNEYDDIDFESRRENAAKDFHTFFQRWHPIYGHLAASAKETDINVCNNYVLPGFPPVKCTRLLLFLVRRDWPALQSELENQGETHLNRDNLFYVFKEALNCSLVMPPDIQQKIAKWLISQLLTQTSITETETATLFESKQLYQTSNDTNLATLLLARIAMFIVSGGLRRYPDLVVENYKGVNLFYSPKKYYAWPCSAGGFSLDAFQKAADTFALSDSNISQIIVRIDELAGEPPLVDLPNVLDIETKAEWLTHNDLPAETCLMLVLALKLKDWPLVESWLDTAKPSFILRNHVCFVYDEVLKNIDQIKPTLALKLAQWLWAQINWQPAR